MYKILVAAALFFTGSVAMADTYEIGWDRPGQDYYSYEMINPRAILCQNRCQRESRCRAWTYVKPGVQGTKARCWLKEKVPAAVANSCCTSGVKE